MWYKLLLIIWNILIMQIFIKLKPYIYMCVCVSFLNLYTQLNMSINVNIIVRSNYIWSYKFFLYVHNINYVIMG